MNAAVQPQWFVGAIYDHIQQRRSCMQIKCRFDSSSCRILMRNRIAKHAQGTVTINAQHLAAMAGDDSRQQLSKAVQYLGVIFGFHRAG